jgi:hypothetical protein
MAKIEGRRLVVGGRRSALCWGSTGRGEGKAALGESSPQSFPPRCPPSAETAVGGPQRGGAAGSVVHTMATSELGDHASYVKVTRPLGGAGDRDRTGTTSLEGWSSTIELHPRGDHGATEWNAVAHAE